VAVSHYDATQITHVVYHEPGRSPTRQTFDGDFGTLVVSRIVASGRHPEPQSLLGGGLQWKVMQVRTGTSSLCG
jgi:hypothetical protein